MLTAQQCCRSTLCDVEAGPWVQCIEQAQRTAPPMPTTDIRGGLPRAVIWCRSRRSSSATNATMSRRYDRTVIFCRFEMVRERSRSLRTRSVPVTPSTDPWHASYGAPSQFLDCRRTPPWVARPWAGCGPVGPCGPARRANMGLSNHTSRRGRVGGACNRRDRRCPTLHVKNWWKTTRASRQTPGRCPRP